MNVFDRTQLRLTAYYGAVIFAVLLVSDAFINYTRTLYVENEVRAKMGVAAAQQLHLIIQQAIGGVRPLNYVAFSLITLLIILASYAMARRALSPVQSMIESQQRFLANAAHELRTPLTVLRTEAELALRNNATMTRDEFVLASQHTVQVADTMSTIINNLLLISSAHLGKHALPFILDPFFKGSIKSGEKKEPGTGLGLPIVKGLVDLHSGIIRVRSEPYKGTQMTVSIPLA